MADPVVHIDISGPGEEAQHRFYGELFGWSVDPRGPGYALLRTGDDSPNGALIESENASVTVGVAVGDLDAAVAHAVELGGNVVMPPTDNGWVTKAQVSDPAGNVITLIQA
jgi:predicted enzyme related to lactoylglutathione lyase